MKNLPYPIKIILNIIFVIIYRLILCTLAGFIVGIICSIIGKEVDSLGEDFFTILSITMIIPVTLTYFVRKKFYISLSDNLEENK